jgi:hypothetical protein
MEPDLKYILQNIINATFLDIISGGEDALRIVFAGRSEEDITEINKYLQDDKNKVTVILGDPRDASDLPCVAIIRNNESENPCAIGGLMESEIGIDDEEGLIGNEYGTDFNNDYSLEVWATNTDIREILYRIVKYGILKNRTELEKKGIMEQRIGGNDRQGPMSPYFPDMVYVSSVNLTCRTSALILTKASPIPIDIRATAVFGEEEE